MRAKWMIPCSLLLCLMLVTGCAAPTTGEPEAEVGAAQAVSVENVAVDSVWTVSLRSCETQDNLRATLAAVQYGGDVEEIAFETKPAEGKTFLLVELQIAKQNTGSSSFVWDQLYVRDAAGNAYKRHENDTFLETVGLPRIKATDIKLGTSEGFICFEIPKSSANDSLALVYQGENGDVTIPLALAKSVIPIIL